MKRFFAVMVVCWLGISVQMLSAEKGIGFVGLIKYMRPYVAGGAISGLNLRTKEYGQFGESGFKYKPGYTLKVGIDLIPKYFSIEGELYDLPEFMDSEDGKYGNGTVWHSDYYWDFKNRSINLIGKYPFDNGDFTPYLTVGRGTADMKYRSITLRTYPSGNTSVSSGKGKSDMGFYKMGGGIDLALYKGLYLSGEYAFWMSYKLSGVSNKYEYRYSYYTASLKIGYRFFH